MKKLQLLSFLFFLLVFSNVKAQYVTISDTGMVAWLTDNYPSAMVGNQMDTTHSSIVNEINVIIPLGIYTILNLNGIQYFDNAANLDVSDVMTIQTIPALPPNLIYLNVSNNNLSNLPNLPSGLNALDIQNNIVTSLPNFPSTLSALYAGFNLLTSLPALPNGLNHLSISSNQLTNLPSLPNSMLELIVANNSLNSLPPLPNGLLLLYCGSNNFSSIPNLPNSLIDLYCESLNLTSLPLLPSSLQTLHAIHNNLTYLPELPSGLEYLAVTDNPILSCLPSLSDSMLYLLISGTSISCISDPIPPNGIIDVPGIAICTPGNLNNCISNNSISGGIFDDSNNNCINTTNIVTNTNFNLFDSQNILLQSVSSSIDDNYFFNVQPGGYTVQIDSSFFTPSVSISCPISGEHFVNALQDSSYTNRDFGFKCEGIDVGTELIVHEGIVFPGQPHSVKAIAGDLSNYFGLNCASGTSGTVQINITGPISYTGYPTTSFAPIVNGNSYSYTITDFGAISLDESFVLNFLVDTTAQAGDSITVTATVTANSLDSDTTNNNLSYTYFLVNSYGPNMKEVNPVNVLPGYEDYFTYTVHFQNLGTTSAFNIRIKDTIDGNLDFSTFRVVNASHNYSYNLSGELLTVYFPNIMLADSASNPEGSKGFIQYQVKPKPNLPLGTVIENTAHIYFDFNPAIVTNTTTNTYVETLSLAEKDQKEFFVYPNPSSGQLTIVRPNASSGLVQTRILDVTGKTLMNESLTFKNGKSSLQTDLASGSYVLIFESEAGIVTSHRLVICR